MNPATRATLQRRIAAFQDASLAGRPTSDTFEQLALQVFAFQHAHSPVARALWPLDMPPAVLADIPAVPVDLFKATDVGTVPPHAAGAAVFRTSGTTTDTRGVHRSHDTHLYDRGAVAWFRRQVPDAPAHTVALLSDPQHAPDSSLSHMVGCFGPGPHHWFFTADGLDLPALQAHLQHSVQPVFVASTAFALWSWLLTHPPALPPGSIVMTTGGFKGHHHSVGEADLLAATAEHLAPSRVVREYGMTELSSQLWAGAATPYQPPPWLRVLAVDPVSGQPLPPSATGQLRFIDLANLDSAVVIDTLDQGAVHADGSVTLHGRLPGAPVRGCSLTVEATWSAPEAE